MPYIKKERRKELQRKIDSKSPLNSGELNYCITDLIITYLNVKGESYQTYNDIIGALEGAKLELYRRKISLYEDKKIQENGDIF